MSSISQIRIRARLAKPPEYVLIKFPRYEREFFLGYANFILGLILSRKIRELLSNLVSAEGIRSDRSIDLRVMIFPAKQLRRQPSRILYGSYSHSLAQISLYPLRISKDRIRKEGTACEVPAEKPCPVCRGGDGAKIGENVHETMGRQT